MAVGPQSLLAAERIGPTQQFQPSFRSWPVHRFTALDSSRGNGGKIGERAPGPASATRDDVLTFHPPYGAQDSHSFTNGPWLIALAGVEGPRRDSICLDASDAPFACGLHARAALTNALAQAVLTCRVHSVGRDGVIEGDCQSPRGDVAVQMAEQGWVRPLPNVSSDKPVAAAARMANAARAGMWGGGWRYRSGAP
jgi:endonuclease YncB( thermonuclease family)